MTTHGAPFAKRVPVPVFPVQPCVSHAPAAFGAGHRVCARDPGDRPERSQSPLRGPRKAAPCATLDT